MKNQIEYKVYGRFALFTDPATKIGGEKFSYHIPTYEALKGVTKSIFWKPTFIWHIDRVRVMKVIRTQSKSVKPRWYAPKKLDVQNDLAIYTYLADVEYQVQAHFEWNTFRDDLAKDRIDGKHFSIAKRMVDKGGRQDIFLGTRECQSYVEPCEFGAGEGAYDNAGELAFATMFHSFDYPDETGENELYTNHWQPVMKNGIIEFPRPEDCKVKRFVREMIPNPPASIGLNEEALQNELA